MIAGREPAQGVLITIPPHTGDATLRFDLHNRHTYSEEQTRAGRGYARYTAIIGVLTMKGELIDRAGVQTEFRSAKDVYERIPAARVPAASRPSRRSAMSRSTITIPAGVDQVSLLGEVLDAFTPAGRESASPGRPVAIVSKVMIEYRPRPRPVAAR